jgi:hypothetical protein
LLSAGYWYARTDPGLFIFGTDISSSIFTNTGGTVSTMKEMFVELRGYSEVPKYIEKEYESLFIMYKLNDFKI